MEKTNGGEATVEIDTEKLGLELMVIYQFHFCTTLWAVEWPNIGSLAVLKPHDPWQGPVSDPNSICTYRKKTYILRKSGLKSKVIALKMGWGLPLSRGTGVLESVWLGPRNLGFLKCSQGTQKRSNLSHSLGAGGSVVKISLTAT